MLRLLLGVRYARAAGVFCLERGKSGGRARRHPRADTAAHHPNRHPRESSRHRRGQSASSRDAVDSSVCCCCCCRRRRHHHHHHRGWRKLVAQRVGSDDDDDKSVGWRRGGNDKCHSASGNVASLTSRHRGRTRLTHGLGRRAHRPGGLVPVAPAVRG